MLKDVMLDILGCRISILMFEYMVVRWYNVENGSISKSKVLIIYLQQLFKFIMLEFGKGIHVN